MTETATLAGGCFWCLEPLFAQLRGVLRVEPGYAGGHLQSPTYKDVCTGRTGHAEAVEITFDPEQIKYANLLEIFFAVHDPTTPDRQGADVGEQYRSAIFFRTQEQHKAAAAVIGGLAWDPSWEGERVVTQLVPFSHFYPAEEYHRDYFHRNPTQGYCRVVIAPKLQKFQKRFMGRVDPSS